MVCALTAVLPGAARLHAQEAGAECAHGRISSVFIDNHSVFDLSDPDMDGRLRWAYRLANRLHPATREDVIRRELLFQEGDCYQPEVLRESERILRASTFIANADVFGVPQPDGTYHVIVDTQDEWSLQVQPQVGRGGQVELRGLNVQENNLFGTGRRLAVFSVESRDTRIYGASFGTPQLFNTRWDLQLSGGKTPVGNFAYQALAYPFVGETGRWAMRQHVQQFDRYFEFLAPTDSGRGLVLLPESRRTFDVGAVYRTGRRGNLFLLGGALLGEWIWYPADAVVWRDNDRSAGRAIPLEPVSQRFDSVANVRAMLLIGQRNVYFVRRRGLNTVNGNEDIRLGVEAELGFGHTVAPLSTEQGLSLDAGLFAAGELPGGVLTGTQIIAEGKRSSNSPPTESEWADVLVQLDAFAYWRPSPESRHTVVGAFSAAGGWYPSVPLQLTLGGRTGLRGAPDYLYPGAQRAVFTLEHRQYLGWPLPNLFDLGTAAFVDVGRIWAGDAPFGVTSDVRSSVGVGLRAALPPGSQQTLRVDFAAPIASGVRFSDVQISVALGQAIGSRALRNDPQLRRSSRRGISASLFSYPN